MCTGDVTDLYAQGSQAQGQVHTHQSNQECTCYKCYVTLLLP